nr:CAP-Gly domain-containing linker protein 1 isoform X9 [Crassostrea gigas]
MKGYLKKTTESRNKERYRNMDEKDQEKKRSPLKSPRLCEENWHLQIEIKHTTNEGKRHYHPQKYNDPAPAQPRKDGTYFQTLPHDELGQHLWGKSVGTATPSLKIPLIRKLSDSYEHKPRPPSESSLPKKPRKQRSVIPQSLDKKAHKQCHMQLTVKEREINKLKGIIDSISKPLEVKMIKYDREQSKKVDDLQRQVKLYKDDLFSAKSNLKEEQEKTKLLIHQNQEKEDELSEMRLKYMKVDDLQRQVKLYKDDLFSAKSKVDDLQRQVKLYKDDLFSAKSNLKEEQEKTKLLIHQNQEKEDELSEMRLKYMKLRKGIEEYRKIHERSAERERKLVEQQTELERMCKQMGKVRQINDALSEKNDDMDDRIRKLQSKLDHLERVEETHHLCVEIRDEQSRYIKKLECEVEAQDQNFVLLQNEYDDLDCRYSTMKAEHAKMKHLQSELDAKTGEVNKLTQQIIRLEEFKSKYYIVKSDNKKVWENCSDLKRKLEDKVNELENVNGKVDRAESLSREVKILQREKANVEQQNSDLTKALQAKGIEIEVLNKHRERIENLSKEYEKQRRTREKGEHEMTELEQVVQKKTNEVEELNTRLEEFSKKCSALHRDKEEAHANISNLTDALNEKKRDIESLTNELERSETHVSVLKSRIDDMQRINTDAVDKSKSLFQNENASLKLAYEQATFKIKDLSKQFTNAKRDKENAESQIDSLSNILFHKKKELESVQNELARSKEDVLILSKDIKDIQSSKRLADEKLQGLQTENASLKSALSKATNEIDDFLNKGTNLHKYKTDAEHKASKLMNALREKDTENEALREQLARAEKKVSIISQDIKDIHASNRQVAEEKLQSLQTENASLKSALSKATNEIEDLVNKGSNLQKYKADAEHKTSKLMNALREKDTENEALREQLARAEKKVSIISQDIKDIHASNRQVAEEKLQSLQTENASLKSALSKATNEIEDLVNKGSNLQKYKADAEHKTSTLMNSLREKGTENEALREQLARAEKKVSILSKDIKDMQASKRQVAEEKLQSLQTENTSLKSALSKATNEIEDIVNKTTNLQKYNTDAEHKTSTLMNALREKDTENKALREQLARAEKNVSILSKDIKDMQASKRQVAEEKLQSLQTENASLKSALSKATNEIEDLLNKDTNLQKYKTDAEHKTSSLMNALKDKETEIEALSKQLARSEENVSILSKDIKNIQESKRQVADEKLQDLQTENDSLKLTLAEATTKIDDLWNKCTNLQKYKSDTELEIGTLLNVVEEKETEIETLHKHLARSEKNVSILSKDIKDIQGSKRQAADEKVQSLQTENASIKLELAKATTEIDAFRNKCTDLQKYKTDTEHTINSLLNAVKEKETKFEALNTQLARKNNELSKDKENAENQKNRLSKALEENKKEIETMQNDIARYKEKIWTLTKTVEDIKGSKNQAADENIKGLQKKIGSLESELRNATTEMNDLSYKYKCLQKDKESAEYTINKLSRDVQEKEKEISSLIEDLAKANEKGDREEHAASANSIQKLTDENASLNSKLSQLSNETEKKVSALTKEIKSLQQSKGTSSEEYNARKLYEENEFLKAQLDRTSRSYEQLRKDYNEVKREKDHALNRLSSVAGEKLRNNNPGIADLSDENRPINLGEKFSQLYDDQWTDAIEHLEEMGYSETDGIRRLLDILKAVFDECVKLSDTHFNQLKELTGTSHLPSDQLKKLKDLRKATAVHSVAKIKQVVNDYMSTAFSKEKAACQTYIDRSIELCWLMSVQDPPVVIDFIAVHGQAIDDKILRKFTKTGSKIDFLVWPVIRLHKNGPLLQKGVVQPI